MDVAVFFHDVCALGAFAGARAAEDEDDVGFLIGHLVFLNKIKISSSGIN